MKIIIRCIFLIFIILCVSCPIYKYYQNFNQFGISLDTTNWGTFGDFIGGTVGSIFGFISVILIYVTFENQRNTSQLEKFENKYYALIQLHRDNVAELSLKSESGKKVILLIIREFREALDIVKRVALENNIVLNKPQLMELTYMSIFYGVGPNSTRVLINSLNSYEDKFLIDLERKLQNNKNAIQAKRKFDYTPFEGHQSRLGHYFRHLYQTISFVDNQKFLSSKKKKEYVKTIRAQLSNHEQALLFFNSISRIGKPWYDDGLILRYSLIKNLPKSFIDEEKEIDVKEIYPTLIFEWEEEKIKKTKKEHELLGYRITIEKLNR